MELGHILSWLIVDNEVPTVVRQIHIRVNFKCRLCSCYNMNSKFDSLGLFYQRVLNHLVLHGCNTQKINKNPHIDKNPNRYVPGGQRKSDTLYKNGTTRQDKIRDHMWTDLVFM